MKETNQETLLSTLAERFAQNKQRHPEITWAEVQSKLEHHPTKLEALYEMERTGGEPDVVGYEPQSGQFVFCDCAPESPAGRRSLCYDGAALAARKKNKPRGSAQEMAASFGIELLTEQEYRQLQTLGAFDQKTSSWVQTPAEIRELGGALFCDRRYGQVFVYHNGADSYYAARGFRGRLLV